jgi:aminopeptidase YwaD
VYLTKSFSNMKNASALLCAMMLLAVSGAAADGPTPVPPSVARAALTASVHVHMEYLAGDALEGRGSATNDEHKAALYVADELKKYGIRPAANGGYIEAIPIETRVATAPPVLTFRNGATAIHWMHGKQFAALHLAQGKLSGPLQKLEGDGDAKPGAFVFLVPSANHDSVWYAKRAYGAIRQGAAAVLVAEAAYPDWESAAKSLPKISTRLQRGGDVGQLGGEMTQLVLNQAASSILQTTREGTILYLNAPMNVHKRQTWNVVGELPGADGGSQAVVLSAHLDHLGIGAGDHKIYPGADDDASGITAVLEQARVLGEGPPPKRTVIFAFFGSEETGGLGSTYFSENPPLPLDHIVADLEFEMLGRRDPALQGDTLYLTGFERSDLGTALEAHGASLVANPHTSQYFFQRSDNYVLAKKGVVAQTISSFGLHPDYHRPSDDLAHIDFAHLTTAIESMIAPVHWLVNSDFVPQWTPGKKP